MIIRILSSIIFAHILPLQGAVDQLTNKSLRFPVLLNDLTGEVKIRPAGKGVELAVTVIGFPSGIHNALIELKNAPMRFGYEYEPCAALKFAGTLATQNVSISNGKLDNVNTLPDLDVNDILAYSILITSTEVNSIQTCVSLIPNDTRIFTAEATGPQLLGTVYFMQFGNTTKMVSFLVNANRGISSEPIHWQITSQWEKQSSKFQNPSACDTDALLPDILLYNGTDKETLVILGKPEVVPVSVDVAQLIEQFKDSPGSPVLVFSEVPRFSSGTRQPVLCSTLIPMEETIALSTLEGNVNGFVKFTQRSPFHPMKLNSSLTGATGLSSLKVAVHSYPINMAHTIRNSSLLCNPNSFGAIYSGAPNVDTTDNIISHFASIQEINIKQQQGTAESATLFAYGSLFGPNSILWRSAAIYSGDFPSKQGSTPLACGTITPKYDTIRSEALFYYPVVGKATFIQPANRPLEPTTIHVFVTHLFFHNWSRSNWTILRGTVSRSLEGMSCSSWGKPFNPSGMDMRNCENHNGNCPEGYMTEKFGPLFINPPGIFLNHSELQAQFVYTDQYLPLSGSREINGNTLKLDFGWASACTNIRPQQRIAALFSERLASGKLVTAEITQDPSTLKLSVNESSALSGLSGVRSQFFTGYLEEQVTESCDSSTLVPLRQDSLLTPNELPGKIVAFRSTNDSDSSMLHNCSVVEMAHPEDAREHIAVAKIEMDNVKGYVLMKQYELWDTNPSPTTIEKFISQDELAANQTETPIQIAIVEDPSACSKSCSIQSRELFNPLFVNTTDKAFKKLCKVLPEYFCAHGDLSALERFDLSERQIVVSNSLQLFGPNSAVNKTLMVKFSGSNLCSCQIISEAETYDTTVFANEPLSREQVQKSLGVALAVNATESWQLQVGPFNNDGTCYRYSLSYYALSNRKFPKLRSKLQAASTLTPPVFLECSGAIRLYSFGCSVMLVLAITLNVFFRSSFLC